MLHLIQGLLKLPEYLRVVPCHYKRPLIKNWEQLTNAYNPNQLARELQQNCPPPDLA